MKNNPNEPINPCVVKRPISYADKTAASMLPEFENVLMTGLSKREHAAIQILCNMLGKPGYDVSAKLLCESAVSTADQLFIELNKDE